MVSMTAIRNLAAVDDEECMLLLLLLWEQAAVMHEAGKQSYKC
jgi:hypothetical protein